MYVGNIRLGFACNSSSSHSIVMVTRGMSVAENIIEHDYGWEDFTLVSKDAKKRYLAAQLYANLHTRVGDDIARAVCDSWLGMKFEPRQAPGVDHESVLILPVSREDSRPSQAIGIDRAFFDALVAYTLRDDVAVHGGNDNDDVGHPLSGLVGTRDWPIPRDTGGTYFCRHDATSNFWTLYNPHTGDKARFRFEDPAKADPIVCSDFPELIDLKITNYCPFGCTYCYQGSTPKGEHAEGIDLYEWPMRLAQLQAFEVAIGGGEPTMHPKLEDLIRGLARNNITPNMTTRNLAWFRDIHVRENVLPLMGAVAVSVENADDIARIKKALVGLPETVTGKIRFQHVMGVANDYEFTNMLRAIHELHIDAHHREAWVPHVTLLGYKTVGFGENFKPKPYSKWLQDIRTLADRDHVYLSVGIDTALAAETGEEELSRNGIKPLFYGMHEGKFSMYIDAVEGRFGPSSYCESLRMHKLPDGRTVTFGGDGDFDDGYDAYVESICKVFRNW